MIVEKASSRIGARVGDIDLTQPLDVAAIADIRAALLDNLVLFFVDQKPLTPEQHIRLARYFGEIDIPEFKTTASTHPEVMVLDQVAPKGQGSDSWHADNTYLEEPPMGALLQAHQLPPVGGDTLFASMHAAWRGARCRPAMQSFFEGLKPPSTALPRSSPEPGKRRSTRSPIRWRTGRRSAIRSSWFIRRAAASCSTSTITGRSLSTG